MAGCATCPGPIRSVLRQRVARDLRRVRAIKQLTTLLNRAVADLANKVTADLVALIQLVENIPEPVIDLSELVNWLTCPLLPIAILEDPALADETFEKLDPDRQIRVLKGFLKAYVQELVAIYREGLRTLTTFDLISLTQRYLEEVKRIDLDAESFARSVVICSTISGIGEVDEGCKEEFRTGPYQAFVDEISTFSFTGAYPEGFDPNVQVVLNQLAEAERKLSGWRVLIITGF